MKVQVLVATMNQKDDSLLEKMNIQSDAIVGNQCDRNEIIQQKFKGHTVTWLSFKERGVGLNRNNTLMRCDADYCIFADDDVRYNKDYAEQVAKAFEEMPQADVLIFGIDRTRNGEVFQRDRHSRKRLHIWNAMKYGTYCMAARVSSMKKKNISFSQLYGGGSLYSHGEDTLFLLSCFRQGLKLYTHEYVLGTCAKDTSSWFSGYHEKFFYDKGALIACAFPKMKHLVKWYFWLHFRSKSSITMTESMRQINKGIKGFNRLEGYKE